MYMEYMYTCFFCRNLNACVIYPKKATTDIYIDHVSNVSNYSVINATKFLPTHFSSCKFEKPNYPTKLHH